MTADAIVDTRSLPFKLKVAWFKDILQSRDARCYLWSLYYAGEAYVELHPEDVYVDKLPPKWGALLERHLADETRHAAVFRQLLAAEGATPEPLEPHEDLGYHLLTNVVPDVVAAARDTQPLTARQASRYFGFLHALELRSISDLCALRQAALEGGGSGEVAPRPDIAAKLDAILRDERFHATYSRRAMMELAQSKRHARATFELIRDAERRHYHVAVSAMLRRFEQLGARPRSLTGRLRWGMMKLAARLGLAFPALPIYEHMPRRLVPVV